ncbi:hypothetical protein NPIL_649131 [Nephila pilipes]|uniref:Uncharacterized protein n=1 Tax=Nephila pilipes TaxID=299642 RepID=A0A8X6TK77_NEPPI|nr:hypothetical protein NPIL_649131 [Nephila pilipes]
MPAEIVLIEKSLEIAFKEWGGDIFDFVLRCFKSSFKNCDKGDIKIENVEYLSSCFDQREEQPGCLNTPLTTPADERYLQAYTPLN